MSQQYGNTQLWQPAAQARGGVQSLAACLNGIWFKVLHATPR